MSQTGVGVPGVLVFQEKAEKYSSRRAGGKGMWRGEVIWTYTLWIKLVT
jgi:hypothetical protein